MADGKTIIEPKGYERDDSVSKKTALAESLGYVVNIMRKEDLQYAFEYVEKTYKTKKFYTLYDEYKPKYTYICANCLINFSRDSKLKRNCKEAFCSQSCSGKYRKFKNKDLLTKPNKGQFGHPENQHNKIKLTKEQALYIYYEEEKSYTELAKLFNLNKTMIYFIKKKKTYKWIHDCIDEVFQPKKYKSLGDYHTEKKNERLNLIKEVLIKIKRKKIKFNTQNALAKKIIETIFELFSLNISVTTLRDNLHYRNLLKTYLSEQSNF